MPPPLQSFHLILSLQCVSFIYSQPHYLDHERSIVSCSQYLNNNRTYTNYLYMTSHFRQASRMTSKLGILSPISNLQATPRFQCFTESRTSPLPVVNRSVQKSADLWFAHTQFTFFLFYSSSQKKVPKILFVLNDDCIVWSYYSKIMVVCLLCSVLCKVCVATLAWWMSTALLAVYCRTSLRVESGSLEPDLQLWKRPPASRLQHWDGLATLPWSTRPCRCRSPRDEAGLISDASF